MQKLSLEKLKQATSKYFKINENYNNRIVLFCDKRSKFGFKILDTCITFGEMMANSGIRVYIQDEFKSTPELNFTLRYIDCELGILIDDNEDIKIYNKEGNEWSYEYINKLIDSSCDFNDNNAIQEEIIMVDEYIEMEFANYLKEATKSEFYSNDYIELKNQMKRNETIFKIDKLWPVLNDINDNSGECKGHYFHQDLVVAQKIYKNNPKRHIDIGSRIDGFVAHVASFREIEVLDIRPLDHKVKNIKFKQADLMKLPQDMKGKCESISCLHALEHFGLGRYGDPIDINGSEKGLFSIYEMLKEEGVLYLSVPIGRSRIEFNAHRVFDIKYILELIKDKFDLKTFCYVDDRGDLHEDVVLNQQSIDSNCSCNYGCGIFELLKI